MRVIAGVKKGMKLIAPKEKNIRPTTDRIKEAIFGTIQFNIKDSVVLDLFAGSGALGIEALSRGAGEVVFVDNKNIELVKSNLKKTGFTNYTLLGCDYIKAIKSLDKKFSIVFIDPPYESGRYLPALDELRKSGILNNDALIILEHRKTEIFNAFGYETIKIKEYGDVAVTYLKEVPN